MIKRTNTQMKKVFNEYYSSMSDEDLQYNIKMTQERLKIMLLVAKERKK